MHGLSQVLEISSTSRQPRTEGVPVERRARRRTPGRSHHRGHPRQGNSVSTPSPPRRSMALRPVGGQHRDQHRRGYEAHGACGDGSVPCCPKSVPSRRSRLGRSPAGTVRSAIAQGAADEVATGSEAESWSHLPATPSSNRLHGHFRDASKPSLRPDSASDWRAELGIGKADVAGVHVQAAHAPSLPRRQTSSAARPTLSRTGRTHAAINDRLSGFLLSQPVFFVASAPLSGKGLVNCSPKSNDGELAVIGPASQSAHLDRTGSGVETIAHLREERPDRAHVLRLPGTAEGRPDPWPRLGCRP